MPSSPGERAMKSTGFAALVLAVALPAWAQDAKPTEGRIDANFTWSLVELASVPAGEAQSVSVNEVALVITGNEPGPFHRLGGRCLFLSRTNGEASGSCQLADADGDQIFERVEEAGGKGHAVISGGTGKFAGLSGEYEVDASGWYASVREGMHQGVGTKKGVWRMSGS
jgi:hypothetical protein